MLATTRHERIAAARTWDRAFGRALSKAMAEALVYALAEFERPTAFDLAQLVGEDYYDPAHAELVAIGDLVGKPGQGPSVADFVGALEELDDGDLRIALERELVTFVD